MKKNYFFFFKIGSLGLSFLCLLFLLFSFSEDTGRKTGEKNIAFVLDVSESMKVEDIEGKNRLQAAKKYISDTLIAYPHATYSLSIFAGESMRILPFTTDINLLATFVGGIDHSNLSKQGTRIDLALEDALKGFIDNSSGVIVLLTDGDESTISLNDHIKKQLAQKDINLMIVGIGTTQGGYIPTGNINFPYKLYQGKAVIATVNEGGLKLLAKETQGKYHTLSENLVLDNSFQGDKKRKDFPLLLLSFLFWGSFLGIGIYQIYKK